MNSAPWIILFAPLLAAAAIAVLQDLRNCYNENFEGFSFTRFDGTRITI